MIDLVRLRSDMRNTEFVTSSEILSLLNIEIAKMFGELVALLPGLLTQEATINAVTGTFNYNVPSNFYKTLDVFKVSQQRYIPCPKVVHQNSPGVIIGFNGTPSWSILGLGAARQLHFEPDPGTNDYVLRYVTTPPQLAEADDTFDGVNGWEEWPIWATVISVLIAEKQDTRDARAQLIEERRRIISDVANGDLNSEDIPASYRPNRFPRY